MHKILIIDDEINILTSLEVALEDEYTVFSTTEIDESFEILLNHDIDLILLDQRLGKHDGLQVLQDIKQTHPGIIIIAMTAYGTIEATVEAIQRGAYYYITKPIDVAGLILLINKALEYKKLSSHFATLTRKLEQEYGTDIILGSGNSTSKIVEMIERIKDLDVNILITGESGTGKGLVAKAIHYWGSRSQGPFEIVNCAAIPYNLLESEMFGYEKGAFTGANHAYAGKFRATQGGTLFFDEIGDMEIALQSKLLHVIQERSVNPLGSEKSYDVDFRLVSATNKNLEKEIKNGQFREDLFFRLNVIHIHMPALRERKEDIPALAAHFINKYNKQFKKSVEGILPSAINLLEKYNYPGNIRELQNIIERAVALSQDTVIKVEDLPKHLIGSISQDYKKTWLPTYVGETLDEIMKKSILATLDFCGGNKTKAAKMLGMSDRHLRTKVKEYHQDTKNTL